MLNKFSPSKLALGLLVSVAVMLQLNAQYANAQQAVQSEAEAAKQQVVESDEKKPDTTKASDTTKETGDKAETETLFTRIETDDKGNEIGFQTAIVRYTGTSEKGKGFTVDLVGAVHIGEQAYYESLNKEFEQYESLLYELVAPEGTIVEKDKKRATGFSAVSSFQRGMKDMLGLDFQLDHVDYTKKNFVHADMSPEEFAKSMKANDESVMKIFFKMIGHGVGAQGGKGMVSNIDLMSAMFGSGRELNMKRLMARQLQNGDAMLSVFEGKDGSTIITHRNRKALDVLKKELEKGKTNVGIFYGAGHFPEMERELIEDFKVTRTSQKWLTAWSLIDPKADGGESK